MAAEPEMYVALAYAFDGHDPDEVIGVDKQTGRNLIFAGRARPADAPSKTKSPAAKRANTTAPPTDPPEPPADNTKEADE